MNLTLLKQRCAEAEEAMEAARACAGDPRAEAEALSNMSLNGPRSTAVFRAALALELANLARASALKFITQGGRR